MSRSHVDTHKQRARPVITNMSPMFLRVQELDDDRTTKLYIEGHGFWNNANKIVDGVETTVAQVPLFNKKHVGQLRAFLVPVPAPNMDTQYNMFSQPLSAYDLYKNSVRSSDKEPTMQTKYPGFTGIEVTVNSITENQISLDVPPVLSAGFIDVLVSNRAGYSRASTDFYQSSDGHAINLTTTTIESSGMLAVGKPTYWAKLTSSFQSNQFNSIVFNYTQQIKFDSEFAASDLHIEYVYNLATDAGMNNIVQSISSTEFKSTVTFTGLDVGTKYYTTVESIGDVETKSAVDAGTTTSIDTLNAQSSLRNQRDQVTFYYQSEPIVPDTYTYILATDKDLTQIVQQHDHDFVQTKTFFGVEQNQTFFSAVSCINIISNVVSAVSNPCYYFSVTPTRSSSTNNVSLNITSNALESIFVTEILSDKAKGMVTPIANDQYNNLWLAVGEGFFRPDRGNSPGKIVFDSGWPKYYGYWHEDMYELDSVIFPGLRTSYDNYKTRAWLWSPEKNEYLKNGGSIYDESEIPGAFAFLHNSLNFIKRKDNPTGRVLYINDYSQSQDFISPVYGPTRFYSTFKDIVEYSGMQFEQLSGTYIGVQGGWYHDRTIGTTETFATSSEWKSYLQNFDIIIWCCTNYQTDNYVHQNLVDALEDYYDNGGGMYIATDHDYFQGCTYALMSSYGVDFTGRVDRTINNIQYKVSQILANREYIPTGTHPLFNNISKDAYIHAGWSEGRLIYVTDESKRIMINSEYISSETGQLTVTNHTDRNGTPLTSTNYQVRTASGCVSAIQI